jgi:hypothetical protein
VTIEIDQDEWVLASPKRFTVEKADGDRNEDAFAISRRHGVSALSDGASVSFDSAAWATILVRQYACNPRFDRGWVNEAISKFAKLYDRDTLPWMQQASFDRGSFASLLGIRHVGAGVVYVLAIGDSVAVLCDGDQILSSVPYSTPAEFEQRPQLLSTNAADNTFVEDIEPVSWNLREYDNPALLCMTDALGQWVLAHRDEKPSPIAVLRSLKSLPAFKRFVTRERGAGGLRRDDTTLLAYWQFQRG